MARTARVEKKSWIPEVPKERIKELAKRIKPVVRMVPVRITVKEHGDDGSETIIDEREHPNKMRRDERGERYYIKPVDPFNIAYAWDPKPSDKATGLKHLCDIRTYHTYGYYGSFKPSIAEVLAQIPAEHLDIVVAFEIVDSPKDVNDLNREREAMDAGYHVATTRLYVRE